jgi:hypothetical protein
MVDIKDLKNFIMRQFVDFKYRIKYMLPHHFFHKESSSPHPAIVPIEGAVLFELLQERSIANLKLPIDAFYRESRSGVNIAKRNITTGLFGLLLQLNFKKI